MSAMHSASTVAWIGVILFVVIMILPSIRVIGPTNVGLVRKRFGSKKLKEDNVLAFNGEAGYQADLLAPGWQFKWWIVYAVEQFPRVQVPGGEIGVVIAQVGQDLPIGAKSAVHKKEFGNFSDLRAFIDNGGQKGVQRHVLPPGATEGIHPLAFLVITKNQIFGVPIDPSLVELSRHKKGNLDHTAWGLTPEQLEVQRIEPGEIEIEEKNGTRRMKKADMVGVITILEGDPLPPGDIASRIGGFSDIAKIEEEAARASDVDQENLNTKLVETVLGSKNQLHNNYQDFQAFLDSGGKIGLQHDVLLYGAYLLNPFLVRVEKRPMLVVEQGEVAVIKSYVGLPPSDTSGEEFKYGSLVRPGHRGIWEEPLRTGKYAINPRIYKAEIVPTCILTLNWAEQTSKAHMLDSMLSQIEAKSREGFVFKIDLQVQIHVPDTKASRVISMVGTMANLVNEVLQAAVGNHFRDKIQSMQAVRFIETRQEVQEAAFKHISGKLADYAVETKGVYIQDVILPPQIVEVLTQREIANQNIETFKKQQEAEEERINKENTKGKADKQAELASSEVKISIEENLARAKKAEADGQATYIRETGQAQGAQYESIGKGQAAGYTEQVHVLGRQGTTLVNIAQALASGKQPFMPKILAMGGSGGLEGVFASLIGLLSKQTEGDAGPPSAEEAYPAEAAASGKAKKS